MTGQVKLGNVKSDSQSDPEYFWDLTFFGPEMFLVQNYFWDPTFLDPNFWDLRFLNQKNIEPFLSKYF